MCSSHKFKKFQLTYYMRFYNTLMILTKEYDMKFILTNRHVLKK